jgi:plasmid stability protein
MPVNFSIKDVPDVVADRLRARARRHHRSLQGELRAILDEATSRVPAVAAVREGAAAYGVLAPGAGDQALHELHQWAKAHSLAGTGDSAEDIRQMRDRRAGRVERVAAPSRTSRKTATVARNRGRR